MKLKTKKDEHNTLGFEQDTKEFSIDTESSMIVSILRDKLYKNKVGAVCREVASNCRDANREAGRQDVPVVITIHQDSDLIGDGNTLISFKDSGIGISPDRIENVFLKYGGSTKRDNNNQTGGFGIGAKTPFAYTNNFVITTIANVGGKNMEYIYQAVIIADGQREKSQLILVSEEQTSKHTGTVITVPIGSAETANEQDYLLNDRIAEFEWECIHATAMWDVKPNLIGFKNPDVKKRELKVISKGENWSIVEDERNLLVADGNIVASVDGIPYSINTNEIKDSNIREKLRSFFDRYQENVIVIKIKTGEVSLSASREDIEYIPENLKLIIARYDELKTELKKDAVKLISNAKSLIEKATIYNFIVGGFYNKNNLSKLQQECNVYYNSLGNLRRELLSNKEVKELPLKISEIASSHNIVKFNFYNPSSPLNIIHMNTDVEYLKKYKIYYRDCNSCARRNETIKNEGNDEIIFIMPSKCGKEYSKSPKTLESKAHLIKLLKEVDIELLEYSEVVKVQSTTRKKEKKENVTIPFKYFSNESYIVKWESAIVEFQKLKGGVGGNVVGEEFDKEKTILLTLESIGDLKRNVSYQDVFKNELPDYIDVESYHHKFLSVIILLKNYGYEVFAVSKQKEHYFKNLGFKTNLIEEMDKVINSDKFKKDLQNLIDYEASCEVDIFNYINVFYTENPIFLKLVDIDVDGIKKSKKEIAKCERNIDTNKLDDTLNTDSVIKIKELLKITPKDFGVNLTEKDIDKAFDRLKKEYPLFAFTLRKLEGEYDYDFNSNQFNRTSIINEAKKMAQTLLNEKIMLKNKKFIFDDISKNIENKNPVGRPKVKV